MNKKNLANAQLLNSISDVATEIEVKQGQGASLPPVPFFATITPMGVLSTIDNSEIVQVTNVGIDDKLTVIRGQRDTTPKSFSAEAVLANGIYVEDLSAPPVAVTVTTGATTAAKVGSSPAGNYSPIAGDIIEVTFVNGSNVANPTLNIDGSGARNIRLGQSNASTLTMGLGTAANSNVKIRMWYDGTYWQLYGANDNTNTTYSEITEAEITAGTASTARTITGRRAKFIVDQAIAGSSNADTVDGFHASSTPTPNNIPVLDGNGKVPIAAIPSSMSKYVDANGWTVYDYGGWKEYQIEQRFDPASINSNAQQYVSPIALPAGVSSISNVYVNMTAARSYAELIVTRGTETGLDLVIRNLHTGALNATYVTVHWHLKDR